MPSDPDAAATALATAKDTAAGSATEVAVLIASLAPFAADVIACAAAAAVVGSIRGAEDCILMIVLAGVVPVLLLLLEIGESFLALLLVEAALFRFPAPRLALRRPLIADRASCSDDGPSSDCGLVVSTLPNFAWVCEGSTISAAVIAA